jgi:ribosomal protein S27E
VPAIYRPRHPDKTVLGQVLFHHFEQFVAECENRFERQYGFFRPIIKEAIERYLDCGNPHCRFAQIRCPDCGSEFLPHFSCRTRGVCPSCQAKPLEQWEEWLCEELLLDGPRRQVVFAIPKMLRRPGASLLFSGRGGSGIFMIVAVDSFLERKREGLRLSGDFAVVRNDDSAGRPPSQPSLLRHISLFLTSIRGRDYLFHMKGSLDSTLNGSVSRAKQKSKFL